MWTWLLADTNGVVRDEITHAKSRQVSWPYRDAASASFTIPGDADEAQWAMPAISDVLVYKDDDLVFRGRTGAMSGTLDADSFSLTVPVVDYRTVLSRRTTLDQDINFPSTDNGLIAWNCIAYTQQLPGGNLGITRGSPQTTGRSFVWTVPASKPIDEAINDLMSIPMAGAEWWIDAHLRFNIPPQRGSDKGERLVWGTNIAKIDYKWNPDDFANVVIGTGKTGDSTTPGVPPQVATATDIATRPEGRFEKVVSNTDLDTAAKVMDLARYNLGYMGNISPAWTVTLTPGAWEGFDHIDVGDTVWLVAKRGCWDLNEQFRVTQIDVTLSEDEDSDVDETVTLTLGGRKEWLAALFKTMPRDLARLARS